MFGRNISCEAFSNVVTGFGAVMSQYKVPLGIISYRDIRLVGFLHMDKPKNPLFMCTYRGAL